MELLVDTRQQDGKHRLKHHELEQIGYQLTTCKLDFGDYMLPAGRVSVDTKANIAEIHGNLTKGHERFRNECQRALDANSVLVVLVINKVGVRDLSSFAVGQSRRGQDANGSIHRVSSRARPSRDKCKQ